MIIPETIFWLSNMAGLAVSLFVLPFLPSRLTFKKRRGIGPGALGIYQWLWDTEYHIGLFIVLGLVFAFSAWVNYDPCSSPANWPLPWYSWFHPGVC